MRASQAPEQWKLVLDAMNADDYELANKLAVKYNFASKSNKDNIVDGIRHVPLKGDYVANGPDGKIHCHKHASALSRYLGLSFSYVRSAIHRLEKHDGAVQRGKMKGWVFWIE